MNPYIWRPDYVAAIAETDDHCLRELIARVEATLEARLSELGMHHDEEYGKVGVAIEAIRALKAERLPVFRSI